MSAMTVMDTQLLKVSEVATLLSCSAPTVRRLIRGGQLPAVRLGHGTASLRVSRDTLDQWLETHATTTQTPRGPA